MTADLQAGDDIPHGPEQRSRRQFLRAGAALGAGLVIGVHLPSSAQQRSRPAMSSKQVERIVEEVDQLHR